MPQIFNTVNPQPTVFPSLFWTSNGQYGVDVNTGGNIGVGNGSLSQVASGAAGNGATFNRMNGTEGIYGMRCLAQNSGTARIVSPTGGDPSSVQTLLNIIQSGTGALTYPRRLIYRLISLSWWNWTGDLTPPALDLVGVTMGLSGGDGGIAVVVGKGGSDLAQDFIGFRVDLTDANTNWKAAAWRGNDFDGGARAPANQGAPFRVDTGVDGFETTRLLELRLGWDEGARVCQFLIDDVVVYDAVAAGTLPFDLPALANLELAFDPRWQGRISVGAYSDGPQVRTVRHFCFLQNGPQLLVELDNLAI